MKAHTLTAFIALGVHLVAQGPVAPKRFFLGSPKYTPTPTGARTFIYEYDEAGVLVAAHDLAGQLPPGIGTTSLSLVAPREVSPWQTVLCTTEYHPSGGWFEMEANGNVGTFYSNPGQQTGLYDGPQGVTASAAGLVLGADYDGGATANLRMFDSGGNPLWTVSANEALAPCFVGSDIYLGSYQIRPITRWDTNGNYLGAFGIYRHVYVLKALSNNQLLIGNNPVDGQPTDWLVRDLATGTETLLYSASAVADVDDAGNIWFLEGSNLVGFQAGATAPSVTIPLSTGITDHQYIAVSGVPVFSAPQAAYTPFGVGCPDPSGTTPTLTALAGQVPRIGTSSTLRVGSLPQVPTIPVFILGFSNTVASGPAGNYPLPVDLGILGWPGCQQLVSVDDSIYTITTNGFVDHVVTIPPYAFLAGMQFHAQALVLYTPMGVAVTNAVTGTAGW